MAVTQQIKPQIYPKVDDEATIVLTYPRAQAILQASWNWPFGRKDMEVYGQHGYVLVPDRNTLKVRLHDATTEEVRSPAALLGPRDEPFSYLAAVVRGESPRARGRLGSPQQRDRGPNPRRGTRVGAHGQARAAEGALGETSLRYAPRPWTPASGLGHETKSPIPFIPTRADNPPGMGGEPCRGRRPCSSCWSPPWNCGRGAPRAVGRSHGDARARVVGRRADPALPRTDGSLGAAWPRLFRPDRDRVSMGRSRRDGADQRSNLRDTSPGGPDERRNRRRAEAPARPTVTHSGGHRRVPAVRVGLGRRRLRCRHDRRA